MSLGKRIAEARKKNDLSQKELADLLFVSNNTISSWETDRTEPSLEILAKLSKVLQCSINSLIHGYNRKLTDKAMILAQGVVEERRVWITYDSFENSELERVIQPRELFWAKDRWYCAAFCELRQDIRVFELDRIQKVKLMSKKL